VDDPAEKLGARLLAWKAEPLPRPRERIAEVIDSADQDALDPSQSRTVEQEVLDMLDRRSG
jgi:hypothetical protein